MHTHFLVATGLIVFFASAIQPVGASEVPDNLAADTLHLEQTATVAEFRASKFQENLLIDDATFARILPIEHAHRMQVNGMLRTNSSNSTPLTARQQRKNIRLIERETIGELRQHLTKAQLRRWRRNYRMPSLGGSPERSPVYASTTQRINHHYQPVYKPSAGETPAVICD